MSALGEFVRPIRAATISTAVMALINGVCSILIARALSPNDFRDYVVVTMAVSVLMPITKGLQVQTAATFLNTRLVEKQSIFKRESHVFAIVGMIPIGWFAATPIFVVLTDTDWRSFVFGGLVLASAFLQARASGTLQGLSRFVSWQFYMAGTCAVQIPVILVIREVASSATTYVLALTIPSILFFSITVFLTRQLVPRTAPKHRRLSNGLGVASLCISIVMLSPAFFLTRSLGPSVGSTLTALVLIMQTMLGLSGLLGSFQLPGYVLAPDGARSALSHTFNALPTVVVCGVIVLLGTKRILHVFGPSYNLEIRTMLLILVCSSYVVWSATSSILNERLANLSRKQVSLIATSTIAYLMPMILVSLGLSSFFALHLFFGLFFFVVLARRSDSSIRLRT